VHLLEVFDNVFFRSPVAAVSEGETNESMRNAQCAMRNAQGFDQEKIW